MAKPTYEDHANLIEDAITHLACADMGVSSGEVVDFPGYSTGAQAVRSEMRRYALDGDALDAVTLLPRRSHLLTAAIDERFRYTLHSVERLGLARTGQLRAWGVSSGPACLLVERHVGADGTAVRGEDVLFVADGRLWRPMNQQHFRRSGKESCVNDWRRGRWTRYAELVSTVEPIPEIAAITEWGRRCCWSIVLRLGESPGVCVATDPTGVKELLRMRDVPDGRGRREALRHWVREHWRQNRADRELEHRVREHLRGSDECDWFGLHCKVIPSRLDLAKDRVAREVTAKMSKLERLRRRPVR